MINNIQETINKFVFQENKLLRQNSILTVIIFMSFLCFPVFAQTGTIAVEINGIENNDGVIQIGLYNMEDGFPDYDKNFKGDFIKASESGVTYKFTDIPVGTYAIAAWHDENENKILDTNFFGIPKENYGFSNNVFGMFGPPSFEDASFKVEDKKELTTIINLE